MDMLQVGNQVTIKVKNILWPKRDNFAPGVVTNEYDIYTGTVMREKWFDSNEVGISTGNKVFAFRRINLDRIVEINGVKVEFAKPVQSKRVEITVQGSKGNTYIVTSENGKKTCTCPGFGFRRTCKHLELVV